MALNPAAYAKLSQLAYSQKADLVHDSFHAIFKTTSDGWCCAIRGTEDGEDWLTDFKVIPIHVEGIGWVHHGFWDCMNCIWEDFKKAVPDQQVILTGHSLGGALAVLLGAKMVLENHLPPMILTFGAPRVSIGDHLYKLFEDHGVPVIQYRHGNDIVPEVPALLGWQHPSEVIEIGLKGDRFADHFIARYVAELERQR